MNYFIDFEATQYSHEIISIGCVNEKGETFNSLVNANPKKVTNFITKLTGITKEEVINAPSADTVFSNFYDWITKDNNASFTFYCYGDTDITFIESNLKRAQNLKAICALSIIGMHLKDYADIVKTHYGLIKRIKLIKLIQYYRNEENIEQAHNALEDAIYLKEVYDAIQAEGENVKNPFPEYASAAAAPKSPKPAKKIASTDFTEPADELPHISSFKGGKFECSYHSWAEAVEAIMAEEQKKCSHVINVIPRTLKAFKATINTSIQYNHKPYGRRWKVHGNVPRGVLKGEKNV